MRTIIALAMVLAACSSSGEGMTIGAPDAMPATAVSRGRQVIDQDATQAQQLDARAALPDSLASDTLVVVASPDSFPAVPDTYVEPPKPEMTAEWFGPPPARTESCPPAKANSLGIGKACTNGGGQCKPDQGCGCALYTHAQGTLVDGLPCMCMTNQVAGIGSPGSCPDCGEDASCCKITLDSDRLRIHSVQFLCIPNSCGGHCRADIPR